MMRSMFSGVSGLRVHQTKMDVIANNISNVNTVGFKSSRVTFNEIFSQTLSGAAGPNAARNRGGVNPMQVGLGTNVASVDKLMSTGAAQRTDNPLDLMIQGDGFFVVGDVTGRYFTRAGNFVEDKDGFITLNGMKLLGWDSVQEGGTNDYTVRRMAVQPLQITAQKEYMGPAETTRAAITGNINPITDPSVTRTMSFYDSVGTRYVMDVTLTYNEDSAADASVWDVSFQNAIYPNGDRSHPRPVTVTTGAAGDGAGRPGTPPAPVVTGTSFQITFNTDGHLVDVNGYPAETAITITPDPLDPLVPAATLGDRLTDYSMAVNFAGLNQFVNEATNALADNVDGNAPGHLTGLNVGSDGKITGRYSNGLVRLLGQIPLAKFINPAGLEEMGNNLFVETPNSGPFDGVGSDGEMQGGVLEMANVDLSQEFTEIITTQRGFQANSRIISASDQMLQELVNLVR